MIISIIWGILSAIASIAILVMLVTTWKDLDIADRFGLIVFTLGFIILAIASFGTAFEPPPSILHPTIGVI